jgi:hypothetical protein
VQHRVLANPTGAGDHDQETAPVIHYLILRAVAPAPP